jgi:hypothetical protein
MAALFSPAAEPAPSPPVAAKLAASAGEAAYMERAAKQLKEEVEAARNRAAEQLKEGVEAARIQTLEEQARAAWAQLNSDGPVAEEAFVKVHKQQSHTCAAR